MKCNSHFIFPVRFFFQNQSQCNNMRNTLYVGCQVFKGGIRKQIGITQKVTLFKEGSEMFWNEMLKSTHKQLNFDFKKGPMFEASLQFHFISRNEI